MVQQDWPFDIVLHIFSYLSLADLCRLLRQHHFNFYCTHTLMRRIKAQQWSLDLYSSPNYFAALCNGDLWMRPMERLFCVGYDSRSGYLRFEPKQFRDRQSAWIVVNANQTLRVRCTQWIRPLSEDDRRGEVPVIWTQGDNIKENSGIRVRYRCLYTSEPKYACRTCELWRCHHRPQLMRVSIDSMSVTFEWLQQGLR